MRTCVKARTSVSLLVFVCVCARSPCSTILPVLLSFFFQSFYFHGCSSYSQTISLERARSNDAVARLAAVGKSLAEQTARCEAAEQRCSDLASQVAATAGLAVRQLGICIHIL
jgi:hypothetical protein